LLTQCMLPLFRAFVPLCLFQPVNMPGCPLFELGSPMCFVSTLPATEQQLFFCASIAAMSPHSDAHIVMYIQAQCSNGEWLTGAGASAATVPDQPGVVSTVERSVTNRSNTNHLTDRHLDVRCATGL
jgi:hypothetical protein